MPIDTGATAPTFALPDAMAERSWSLPEALSSGPVVVGVYKSSCRASKLALPVLDKLYQSYPNDDVAVWGVALDSPNVTTSFARRYELTLPLLIDGEGYPTAQALGVTETPTIFLIDRSGAVVWQTVGFDKSDLARLSEEIGRLIDLPPVDVTSSTDDDPPRVPG